MNLNTFLNILKFIIFQLFFETFRKKDFEFMAELEEVVDARHQKKRAALYAANAEYVEEAEWGNFDDGKSSEEEPVEDESTEADIEDTLHPEA